MQGVLCGLNDQVAADESQMQTRALPADGVVKLSMGKKKHVLVKAG